MQTDTGLALSLARNIFFQFRNNEDHLVEIFNSEPTNIYKLIRFLSETQIINKLQ
jgi:hypothetical protein